MAMFRPAFRCESAETTPMPFFDSGLPMPPELVAYILKRAVNGLFCGKLGLLAFYQLPGLNRVGSITGGGVRRTTDYLGVPTDVIMTTDRAKAVFVIVFKKLIPPRAWWVEPIALSSGN